MKVVLASNNAKKLAELATLFDGLGIELVRQGDLGVDETDEPHGTFLENALAKARHASRVTGLPAIADDSGLCVDALGGAPGVISAHYAELPPDGAAREVHRARQDAANNALLLQRLAAHPADDERRANFFCLLLALRHAHDPQPLLATGRWQGRILAQADGDGGFGYDPLMFIPALGRTVARLDAAVKNAHSHRALAAAQMRSQLRDAWLP